MGTIWSSQLRVLVQLCLKLVAFRTYRLLLPSTQRDVTVMDIILLLLLFRTWIKYLMRRVWSSGGVMLSGEYWITRTEICRTGTFFTRNIISTEPWSHLEISIICKHTYASCFGGLVVSMLASGTQVRGFQPGRRRRILWANKSSRCLP
jgi:hypothetical protein